MKYFQARVPLAAAAGREAEYWACLQEAWEMLSENLRMTIPYPILQNWRLVFPFKRYLWPSVYSRIEWGNFMPILEIENIEMKSKMKPNWHD